MNIDVMTVDNQLLVNDRDRTLESTVCAVILEHVNLTTSNNQLQEEMDGTTFALASYFIICFSSIFKRLFILLDC